MSEVVVYQDIPLGSYLPIARVRIGLMAVIHPAHHQGARHRDGAGVRVDVGLAHKVSAIQVC